MVDHVEHFQVVDSIVSVQTNIMAKLVKTVNNSFKSVDSTLFILEFLITGDTKNSASNYKDHCASNPCRNGGECVGLRTTFYCRCKSPNYGTICDKKIGKREIDIE